MQRESDLLSMITDRIGQHELLKITIFEKRKTAKLLKKGKVCIKTLTKEL